jgi:hypothetical protein
MATSELKKIILKKEVVDREIAAAESEWMEAAEALEAAE